MTSHALTQDAQAAALAPPGRQLLPPNDNLAVAFFFSHYALDHGVGLQSFENNFDSTFGATLKAVGLAGLGNAAHSPGLLDTARIWYMSAVRQTNKALSSADLVKNDSTLLCTMLLTQYEVIAGRGQGSLSAWKNHIQGGAALLKLRGEDQLRTAAGARLFIQAVSMINMICRQYNQRIPSEIMTLKYHFQQAFVYDIPWLQYWDVSVSVTNFYSALYDQSLSATEILAQATSLDDTLVAIFSDLPPNSQYHRVTLDHDAPHLFNRTYDIYDSHMAIQMWNSVRATRLMLSYIIRQTLHHQTMHQGTQPTSPSPLPSSSTLPNPDNTTLIEQYAATTLTLLHGILYSLPQHLFANPSSPPVSPSPPSNQNTGYKFLWSNFPTEHPYKLRRAHTLDADSSHGETTPPSLPQLRIFGGYMLPHALYQVGRSDLATPEMRRYAIWALDKIGEEFGVGQAVTFARELEAGES